MIILQENKKKRNLDNKNQLLTIHKYKKLD